MAPAGSTLHPVAVAGEGVTMREIAAVIGRYLDVPVVSSSPEDVAALHVAGQLPYARQPGLQR